MASQEHMMTIDIEHEAEGEYCMPGEISVDNHSNPRFTIIRAQVKDYPGLLRVISWVLNGLELLVENARLTTDGQGMAQNQFWVTDHRGRKLPDHKAELVAERVGDFVVYCTPDNRTVQAQQFCSGPIQISNTEHDKYTVVNVEETNRDKRGQGFLLEVASVMTGLGVTVEEAIIQGCTNCGGPELVQDPNRLQQGRFFKFFVTDLNKHKLDYKQASSLIYTLALILGKSNSPLRPPGSSLIEIRDGITVSQV
jgi:UTP:GlnB (protein PII) uridylyltransferase